jgi:membrane associated rhomboid family serine protease
MFIMPFSTEVHDGKIRLAGLEIIGLCVLVHVFVAADMRRVDQDAARAVEQWQQEQAEKQMSHASRYYEDEDEDVKPREDLFSSEADTASGPPKELLGRLKEVQKTSLIYRLGLVLSDFKLYAVFTSMFTHGGWFHLIGNMIFFYVCGLAMEQYWGYWRFLIIYLVCGIAAHISFAIASVATGTNTNGIPLVGASGAIAGAMGAFFATHSRVKVKLFYMIGFWKRGVWAVPAYSYLGFWFLGQIVAALRDREHSSGVAYTAHIGGFLAGAIFGKLIASDYESSVVDPMLAKRQQAKGSTTKGNAIPIGFNNIPAEAIISSKKSPTIAPEIGNIPEPIRVQESEPDNSEALGAEASGWQALIRRDTQQAVRNLSYAMNLYLQSPERNRQQVVDLLSKIVKQRGRLPFPQNDYYQWGKLLGAAKESKYAIVCFDLAALIEGNPHIQKNSLLEASRLRMQTRYQFDKVKRDMEYLLTIEPQGIFANQAKDMLQQMQGFHQLIR